MTVNAHTKQIHEQCISLHFLLFDLNLAFKIFHNSSVRTERAVTFGEKLEKGYMR